jgi:hypothetical protein
MRLTKFQETLLRYLLEPKYGNDTPYGAASYWTSGSDEAINAMEDACEFCEENGLIEEYAKNICNSSKYRVTPKGYAALGRTPPLQK